MKRLSTAALALAYARAGLADPVSPPRSFLVSEAQAGASGAAPGVVKVWREALSLDGQLVDGNDFILTAVGAPARLESLPADDSGRIQGADGRGDTDLERATSGSAGAPGSRCRPQTEIL